MSIITAEYIIERLNVFKIKSSYKEFMNVFLYKNITPVMEIKYKNRRVAFDVIPISDDQRNIKLIWRKGSEQYATLMKFNKQVSADDAEAVLYDRVEDVIKFIDTYGSIKCSVVIPMYNRAKLIVPLLEKLNAQTLDKSAFEVIFIDDASSDNTIEVVQQLATNFNYRILQRPIPSGNASAPRNEGIRVAYGDYIFFVDSDDYIAEYTLQEALEYAEQNKSDIVFLRLKGVNGRNVAAGSYATKNVASASVFNHFLFNNFHPSRFIRTSLLRNNSILFDQSFTKGEDKLFILSAVCFANKISILQEKDYVYIVQHEEEHLSQKKEPNAPFRVFRLWSYGLSVIFNSADEEKKLQMYNAWLYRFGTGYYEKLMSPQCDKSLLDILQLFIKNKELFRLEYIYDNAKERILQVMNKFQTPAAESNAVTMASVTPSMDETGECKKAHLYRNELEIEKGNRIVVINDDGTREEVESFPKLDVEFKGSCGLLEIYRNVRIKNKIKVFIGEKGLLHLDSHVSADAVSLNLSAPNTTMWVGERSWLRTLRCICNAEPGMEIIMGKDIIMSLDVLFRPTDGHTIIDVQTGAPINASKFGIHVDDHVWIGQSVTVLKDARIPRDCVVGAHSVVGRKKFVPNSIIAGIPAQVIKNGITWDKRRIHEYVKSIS